MRNFIPCNNIQTFNGLHMISSGFVFSIVSSLHLLGPNVNKEKIKNYQSPILTADRNIVLKSTKPKKYIDDIWQLKTREWYLSFPFQCPVKS